MTGLAILVALLLLTTGATVKGLIGVGLPMIAIPGLALFFGLPAALAIVVLPVLAANLWQVWQFRACYEPGGSVVRFLIAGGCGTVLGTLILISVPERALELTLAAILTGYIVLRLTNPEIALGAGRARRIAPPIGLSAGLLQGSTGISGPVVITFFHGQRPSRPEFVFATGAVYATFSGVQLMSLAVSGVLTLDRLAAGVAGLPAVALGLWLGNRIARHVDQRLFDKLVLVLLAWTAAALVWKNLAG